MLSDRQEIKDQIRELEDLINMVLTMSNKHDIEYTAYDHYLDVLKDKITELNLSLD